MTATIQKVRDPRYHTKYLNPKYETEGGDSPGRWGGEGAAALSLSGEVDAEVFERLLKGQHPRQPHSLVQIQKKPVRKTSQESVSALAAEAEFADRCYGFDVPFSPPKGFSAFMAVCDDQERDIGMGCQIDAVEQTVAWFEQSVPLTRRGKGGHRRELAKLVVAMFDHVTSRNGDPQFHTHAVFANECQAADGTWLTLDSRTLHKWVRALGPMYRANLAFLLRKRLGLKLIEATKKDGTSKGSFEIEGIPEKQIERWSSRRSDLIETLEGRGGSLTGASAKALESAALESRQAKEAPPPRDELHARWRAEALEHGFTPEKAAALCHRDNQPHRDESAYQKAWKDSLERLTKSESHFSERRLIQEVTERLQTGHFSGVEIANRVRNDLEQSADIVRLKDDAADRQFTTKEMWDIEAQLLKDIEILKSRPGAMVSEKIAARVFRNNPLLDGEQKDAADQVFAGSSSVLAGIGIAGAGKSTMLKAVCEGLIKAGYQPIALALSGIAKEGIAEKTGIPSRTIASCLYHLDKSAIDKIWERAHHIGKQVFRFFNGQQTWAQNRVTLNDKSVVIVDETGMVHTRMFAAVVHHVVKAGGKLYLTGDPKQLQPIEAGGPFQKIVKDVPTSQLTVNRRQKDVEDQKAVDAIRQGNAAEAFQNYVARERVVIGENKQHTIEQLVQKWRGCGGTQHPERHVIFTQTRAEAHDVNARCQAARLEDARTPHLVYCTNGKERLYRGDRVLFHKADRTRGIENGYRGTIVSVQPLKGELTVRLDRKSQTTYGPKSKNGLVTIPLRDFGPEGLSLGFASTTHKAQGETVTHSYLLMGGSMLDRELAYVQVTRAQETTRIFVDRFHAGEGLKDLIAAVEKSNVKKLAHDFAPREKRMQGPELEHER